MIEAKTRGIVFGILNINKPPESTSRQVVDRAARLVAPAKAGHAGTLDPLATGVLVVCIGRATRLIPRIQAQPKTYRATFLLGRRSDTDDVTGRLEDVSVLHAPAREQVAALLPEFTGRIEQIPPQYSAVHVAGRRAYELARTGKAFELTPRTVEVYGIELLSYDFPELELQIDCGSGTYIRSIGRDLGERLTCGAVMSALVRTRVGPYRLEAATPLEELTADSLLAHLLSATSALADLPRHVAGPAALEHIRHGRPFACESDYPAGTLVAVVTGEDELACLAEYDRGTRMLAPRQVFLR